MTTVSVGEYTWRKDYNNLHEAADEAAELRIISDDMARIIFLTKTGHNGVPLALELALLPEQGFRLVRRPR